MNDRPAGTGALSGFPGSRWLWPAIDRISDLSGAFIGWVMLAVAFANCYEIIARKLFNTPTDWVQDVSVYVMIWFAFITAGYTWRKERHIRVDVVTDRIAPAGRKALALVTSLFTLFYAGLLVVQGWKMVSLSMSSGQVTPNVLQVPVWLVQFGIVLGSAVLALQLIRQIAADIDDLCKIPRKSRADWLPAAVFVVLAAVSVWLVALNPVVGLIMLLVTLLFGGVPVFAGLGLVGAAGFFMLFGGVSSLGQVPFIGYKAMNEFILVALPLFVFGGGLMMSGGIGRELFDLCAKLVGHLPGGLAVATIFAAAVFAAISGSSVATAATIGMIALPAMLANNYDRRLAYGCVAAGGTLGILIPPSAPMIVYSAITDESTGALFMGGVIPGLLLTMIMAGYAVVRSMRAGSHEKIAPAAIKEKVIALKDGIWGLLAPVIVLGGIYTGLFTPTESAAVLILYAFLIGVLRGRIKPGNLSETVAEGTTSAGMILMIIAGAMVMGAVFTQLQLPNTLSAAVAGAGLNPWWVMAAIMLLMVCLGMILEVASILLITIPILYPLIISLGFNGIWFCILVVVNMEMALITPPVGLNLFVIGGVERSATMAAIVRGVVPFIIIMVVFLVLLCLFPQLATWLPDMMGYRS
ncbi:MAG: TRAP transporter large permease subunit [Bacillota bacterium]